MNAWGRFFRDLVVGVPIVFIGTVICAGGLEDACMLLAVSVICTCGFGLLFWLPLCWFVGWLLMAIVRAFSR